MLIYIFDEPLLKLCWFQIQLYLLSNPLNHLEWVQIGKAIESKKMKIYLREEKEKKISKKGFALN